MPEQIEAIGGAGEVFQATPDAPKAEPNEGTAGEEYRWHAAAALFPLLSGDEFRELVADVRERGLLNPIVMHDGKVLDGRNRLAACMAGGVAPRFIEWVDPGCGPVAWVISQNLHRRHLSASQRAVIALDALPLFEQEARKRMSAGGKGVQQVEPLKARDQAAGAFGVNHAYVSDAKAIAAKSPALVDRIRDGEMTITQAKRELKEQAREERREMNREAIAQADVREAVVVAKYATIVIDPPWDWGDEGDQDQLGRARPQYGTMPFNDLLALPVSDWADEDCHIYLWITNRSLPKGFALLERWGFRYVTCLTWVKPSFGMGNYFRGQTEHVLFGVRGSQPLRRKDVGTAFHAARGAGGHSSKPTEFLDIVESCSPGPYLEVFARTGRLGWSSVGAEA